MTCNLSRKVKKESKIGLNPGLIFEEILHILYFYKKLFSVAFTVNLSLRLSNNHDLDYFSSKDLFSNSNGQIKLTGENAMSLFWHLKPTDEKNLFPRFWSTNVTLPFSCQFELTHENSTFSETITKYSMDPQVQRIPLEESNPVKGKEFQRGYDKSK